MPMWSCAWPAPAKINLFLHVTGRRADGYHELQTLFQFLDHGDGLAFRVRRDGRVRRRFGATGVARADDLAVRAAWALQPHAADGMGADIAVTKRLPVGGGLGGGSSDAATVLVALNHLWRCGLDRAAARRDLALGLGADVPVFVRGHAAWAEGVGERLEPAEPREPWYLVLVPPVTISTAAVFADPELTRHTPPITIRDFLSGAGSNVCEGPVRRRFPEVAAALDWLAARGVTARLSGTGASVFAAFTDEGSARRARRALPAAWRGFVARGRNHSPLATRLDALAGD
ncbi:MAG: 4-(cytidine 5'-diphospho)-2-C-methyl-D-erythritol kinase [Halofilum sp. (in: g-proteobacteria)]|nr:4-(cytidine 5'-diphospho)-2-C-methyl-D-erythritol kinase [Halofilum sp. (in: g-proteobacteria)]